MSRENVEVIRTLFETYSRGDYAAAAACLAPGVVYDVYTVRDGRCGLDS
jgi:ketosteroid isomerase-like protein